MRTGRPPDAFPTLDHLKHKKYHQEDTAVPPPYHHGTTAVSLSDSEITALRSVLDRLVAASQQLAPPTPTDLIPIRAAASLAQIHPHTLRKWIHQGKVFRYGRPTAYRVSWSQVMPLAPARPPQFRCSTSWQPGQQIGPLSKPRPKKNTRKKQPPASRKAS